MTWPVLLALAVLTYGTRALSLVVLPPPGGHWAAYLQRVPAPLFAALAALYVVGPGGQPASAEVLAASAAALIAAPSRSMLWILAAGGVGLTMGSLLFG